MTRRVGFLIALSSLVSVPCGALPFHSRGAPPKAPAHHATTITSISYYGSFTTTEPVRVWRGVAASLLVQGTSVASARMVDVQTQTGAPAQGIAVEIASRVAPSRLTISLATNPTLVLLGTYRVRILYASRDIPPDYFLVRVYDRGTIGTITMDAGSTSDVVVGARYNFTAVGTHLANAEISKSLLGASISDARVDSRTSTQVKFSLVAASSGATVDVNAAHFFDRNMVATSVRTDTRASTSSAPDPWLYGGAGTIRLRTVNPSPPVVTQLLLSTSQVTGGTGFSASVSVASTTNLATSLPLAITSSDPAAVPSPAPIQITTNPQTIQLATNVVTSSRAVTLAAGDKRTLLTVDPIRLTKLTLSASSVVEGQQVTGTVTTNVSPPQGSAVVVSLHSSSTFVSVPAQVVVSSGNSATFAATALTGAAAKQATITAEAGGGSVTATLTVDPLAAVLTAMTFELGGKSSTTATVNSGEQAPMRVSLGSAVVAAAGETIWITANPASLVTVPESLVVAAGQSSKNFYVTARPTSSDQSVAIIATLRKTVLTRTLTVRRPLLKEVKVVPGMSPSSGPLASLYPEETRMISVGLTGVAAVPGTVQLSTPDAALLGIPPTVTIPQGQYVGTFVVSAKLTSVDDTATFSAVFEGQQLTRSIEVKRLPRPVSLTTTVGADMLLHLFLTLDRDPPSSGTVFDLTSDNPSRLAIPAAGASGQITMLSRTFGTPLSILTPSGPAIPIAATGNGVEYRVQNASEVVPATVHLQMRSSAKSGDAASATTTVQLWPYVLTLTQTLGGLATAPQITVKVNGAAPSSGAVVTLSMTQRTGVTIPATVTIPSGALTATYQPTIAAGANIHGVTFTATYAGLTAAVQVP